MAALLPAAAWALCGPLGGKYMAWLLFILLSVAALRIDGRWRQAARDPTLWVWALLWWWLAASSLWSSAAADRVAAHLWMYALPLGVVWVALACPRAAALRALQHFTMAAAVMGVFSLWQSHGGLPDWPGLSWLLWQHNVAAEGNQRIVSSMLLALGAALACWLAAQSARGALAPAEPSAADDDPRPVFLRRLSPRAAALGWLVLAGIAIAGLAVQDRRSGMALLPLLLLTTALGSSRGWAVRSGMAALVAAAALGLWTTADTVRERFAEGVQELRSYQPQQAATTSWGIRLRMLQETGTMVAERPLTGHGVGSWQAQWQARVPPGTRLADNSTPHNEPLLLAAQAGLPAAALLLVWLLLWAWRGLRAGPDGVPALLLVVTLASAGLANAVLRDAKFAAPLLLLLALGWAVARPADARA